MIQINLKKLINPIVISVIFVFNTCYAAPYIAPCHTDNSKSLWEQMRNEFKIHFNPNRREIRDQIRWFQLNQDHLYKTLENAGPLINYIHQKTLNRDLPSELVLIPYIESEYHANANSPAGAAGLWQFMPKTAGAFGLHINSWYDDRLDIEKATHGALNYLDYLKEFFEGDWLLAIAAYDTGEGKVLNAIHNNQRLGCNSLFWQLNLPQETKIYLPKLLALVAIIRDPNYYGITLPDIRARPYYQSVEAPPHLPLSAIAGLAEAKVDTIVDINPAFKQSTTGPRTNVHVLLPAEKVASFRNNIALNPTVFKQTWITYNAKAGENLSLIAKKYRTTPTILKKVNNLENTETHKNQQLLVPNVPVRVVTPSSPVKYTVKPGDSVSKIAHRYKISAQKLRAQNGLTNDIIRPGKSLIIR